MRGVPTAGRPDGRARPRLLQNRTARITRGTLHIGYHRGVAGTDISDPPSAGTVLVVGWPARPLWRGVVVVAIVAVSLGFGVAAWRLEKHYSDLAGSEDLGWLGTALANGSSLRTAWVGWAAAALFGYSTLRVLRGRPEPPSVGAVASVSAIRGSLRRELELVRGALTAVGALAALDLGRALVFVIAAVSGNALARDRVGWVLVEAAGLVVATAVLAVWCAAFRQQCRDLGAL